MKLRSPDCSQNARPRDGFTLLELLVVVAMIAVLAAIAVPNFLEAQIRSKIARTTQDASGLAMALEAYRVDFGDYPPNYILEALDYPEASAAFEARQLVDILADPRLEGSGAPFLQRVAELGLTDGANRGSVGYGYTSDPRDRIWVFPAMPDPNAAPAPEPGPTPEPTPDVFSDEMTNGVGASRFGAFETRNPERHISDVMLLNALFVQTVLLGDSDAGYLSGFAGDPFSNGGRSPIMYLRFGERGKDYRSVLGLPVFEGAGPYMIISWGPAAWQGAWQLASDRAPGAPPYPAYDPTNGTTSSGFLYFGRQGPLR